MNPVPRVGRVLDAIGALFFLGGGAIAARAWIGFREVQGFERSPGDLPTAAVDLADHFWRMEKIGVALMGVGIAVFVLAWWTARRRTALE